MSDENTSKISETSKTSKIRRIGVLTSGGDAPGMNAAVRAVTRAAISHGIRVMGILKGYRGLIDGELIEYNARTVSNIINRGGTVLYSDRCEEFKTQAGMEKARRTCEEFEIDGIVAIGGDGTFRGATDLSRLGIPTIGIPGTIDNDITATDYTIGFDTAMNTVVDMVDRVRDTCESHARCNIVEVMGRHAGYIGLQCGIAVGAAAIALKEIPFDEDECVKNIIEGRLSKKRNFIIVVSEGMNDIEANFGEKLMKRIPKKIIEVISKLENESLREILKAEFLGRIEKEKANEILSSEFISKLDADAATKILSEKFDIRFARLAHVQRGGSPTLRDRYTATIMGDRAVELIIENKKNLVVCMQKDKIADIDIEYALNLDKRYKNNMSDEDFYKLSESDQKSITESIRQKKEDFAKMYEVAKRMSI